MKLENKRYELVVGEHAAEITSFLDKETGIEYIWSGDAAYWSGRNPTLFPVIGSSYNKKYWFDGKEYTMGNHGFLRHSEFSCADHGTDYITMKLCNSPETMSQYPFEFEILVNDTLKDNRLTVTYEIMNKSEKPMPFAFGLHPAFRCPLTNDKQFNDYRIEFACPVKPAADSPFASQSSLQSIPLSYELFEQYHSIGFNNLATPYISYTDGVHGVRLSNVGYYQTVFWTAKPGAPFLCLEPWQPTLHKVAEDLPFEQRDAAFVIAPHHHYTTSYTIELF